MEVIGPLNLLATVHIDQPTRVRRLAIVEPGISHGISGRSGRRRR